MISLLMSLVPPNFGDVARRIASDFRSRRIEKGITRARLSEMTGVPVPTIARFEQKGLISLASLIPLAQAVGHLPEVQGIFATAKFNSMEELDAIKRSEGKTKAYPRRKKK